MEDEVVQINKIIKQYQYLAQSKINDGSYGEIYRVLHLPTKQIYAFKVLQMTKLEKLKKVHQAVIEAVVLKKLNHHGIIQLFEIIKKQCYFGFIMELCPYGDLFTLMKNVNNSMALVKKKKKIIVYYLAQLLQTIDYLHDHKIIHRDIKPQNIVLCSDLKLKLIDFGTAKVLSNEFLTQSQQIQIKKARQDDDIQSPRQELVGSANYLSPEALKFIYTQKSDIWAFGVTAYKFYHNHLPFQGQNHYQIFKKITESQIELDSKIEPQFKQLIVLCLKKNYNERGNAKMLKLCTLFKGIDFKNIFKIDSPIFKDELKLNQDYQHSQFLFELALQKKMFFGNYKPRILTISKSMNSLNMAYRYIPTKKIKNQFELSMNDYAEVKKDNDFQIVTNDNRYCFRVPKEVSVEDTIYKINQIIRAHYKLQ